MFAESMGGGMGRVAYEITEAFARKHEVLFIHPGKKTKKVIKENLWLIEVKSKSRGEVAIPDLNLKNIRFIFKTLKCFSPEIVHAQDPGPLSFLLQLWANKNKVPFVYTSHVLPTKTSDFGAKEMSGKMGKFFDSKIIWKYFLNFFRNCDGVIALNESAKKDILKFGYKGKIFNVPNGRNLKLYEKGRKLLPGKKKKLLNVGYFSRRKNQKYLLQVINYLPENYILELVGPALEEKYLLELKDYAREKFLKNVVFLGKLEHDKIPWLLKEASVYVSASKMEVQSLSIIEALASGTPVVGLSNETIDEFIDSSCGNNLSQHTPPNVFALKIKEICSLSENSYRKLSDNAKKKVLHLDWSNVVEETQKVYWELMEKGRSQETGFFRDSLSDFDFSELFQKQAKTFFKKNKGNDLYIFLLIISTFLIGSFYSLMTNVEELRNKVKLSPKD